MSSEGVKSPFAGSPHNAAALSTPPHPLLFRLRAMCLSSHLRPASGPARPRPLPHLGARAASSAAGGPPLTIALRRPGPNARSLPSPSAARGGATSPALPRSTCGRPAERSRRRGRGQRTWRGGHRPPRARSRPAATAGARHRSGARGAAVTERRAGRGGGVRTPPEQPLSERQPRLPSNRAGKSGLRLLPPSLPSSARP